MIPIDLKPLKIVSASAGSGKTYKLVLTYLQLILKDDLEASSFSKIIAMTFTNKAAIEMKQRIIEALNTLGNFDSTNKKSEVYLEDISRELDLKKEVVIQRSKACLKQILHQYEQFNVLTIDKFNLRLIRSFSRDLNMNTDFQTTTNEKDIISEIVDLLLDEINQPNFEKLTNIALKYAKENINDENKWDFKKEVKALAETLIQEKNFPIIQNLVQQDFSIQRYEKVKIELELIKNEIQKRAKSLHDLFFSLDTSQVPGASTTIRAFEKLLSDDLFSSKSTAHANFFSPTICNWFEIDSKKPFHPEVKVLGLEFINYYQNTIKKYFEVIEFKKNFFNIALLQLIAKELENFKKTDNIVLISEFNKLISELLKNEEAPYIYERIGNRYQHYLLDEFQDTSRLQWTNLVPLVHDSLGNNKQNLIVGDPKQSIYRFKNGLAEQFIALPAIYNPENDSILAQKSAYFEKMGEQLFLTKNWRSKKEIISFNNLFFKLLKNNTPGEISDFYHDVEQEMDEDKGGGYVFLETYKANKKSSFVETENEDENEQETNEELAFLLTWIQECKNDGFDFGDICLLGYTAKQCNVWASYLTDNGFRVVSADSLLLGSDANVQFILSYLNCRKNPSSELEAKRFAEIYFRFIEKDPLQESKKYWKTKLVNEKERAYFDASQFIIDYFLSEENFFCHFENLYQLVQRFYSLVGLNELENPFIHQFSDYIFQFDQNFGPDITLFLENYANEGHKIAVQIPENKDAIKILTAHKSKGLEFPIVFIPSLKWNLLLPQSKYLIQNKEHIYYQSISKTAKIDVIREYYEREYQQALLDKINLVYVAFTRPKDRLYIRNIADRGKKEIHFENIMHEIFTLLPNVVEKNEHLFFELGTKTKKEISNEVKNEKLEFHPKFIGENLWFPDISIQSKDILDQNDLSEQQRFGNHLHNLVAQINDPSDIISFVEKEIANGKIEQMFRIPLLKELNAIFELTAYQDLLRYSKTILREQDIVLSANERQRPDLILVKEEETIVLDYKTGLPNPKYIKQISTYCQALQQMNLQNVKGYLFFTGTKKLEQVF